MRFSWSRSLASCILFHAGFQTVIPLVIAGSPTAHPLAAAAGPTTLLSKPITHPMRPSGYLGLDPSCGSPGAGPNVNNPACNPNTISPINGSPTVTGSAAPKPSACPDADTPPEFNDDDDDDDDDDDGASPVPNQGEGPSAPSAKRDATKPPSFGKNFCGVNLRKKGYVNTCKGDTDSYSYANDDRDVISTGEYF